MKGNLHEPRSITIIRHVNEYLYKTSVSIETYAQEVKEHYHQQLPDPKSRTVRFHDDGDAIADVKANGQIISRVLHRTVRMPSDIEESLVMVLPETYRQECVRDLAERYNLLAAAIPDPGTSDDVANLNRLLKETGEVIQAVAPIFEDGKVDENDAPFAKNALKQINDAQAALISMGQRITSILPDIDNVTTFNPQVKK